MEELKRSRSGREWGWVDGNVGECDWLEGRLSEMPLMGQSTYVVLFPY